MPDLKKMLLLFLLATSPGLAHAYIGPGVGLSALGSVISLVVTVLLLIVGFLWYPIKRLIKKRKSEEITEVATVEQENKDSQ